MFQMKPDLDQLTTGQLARLLLLLARGPEAKELPRRGDNQLAEIGWLKHDKEYHVQLNNGAELALLDARGFVREDVIPAAWAVDARFSFPAAQAGI